MGAPNPDEIYDRATQEGERRLSMPPLEQMSTGFIAGVTIVFGIVALAMAEELIASSLGTGQENSPEHWPSAPDWSSS